MACVEYSWRFASLWCLSILAIPGSVVLFVYSIAWAVPHAHNATATADSEESDTHAHPERYAIGFGFAVLLLAFVLYTRLWPTIKHQIRAGVFPFSLCDPMPTTEEEFIAACCDAHRRKGGLQVVSHGWSFYLSKMRATGNRVWTLKYVGKTRECRWKSGTALIKVKQDLATKNLALPHNPTMEFASLGSWIATVSHGHPGTETPDDIFCWVERARVLDVASAEVTDDSPAELLRKFGMRCFEGQYVVLDVLVKSVDNVKLTRRATKIESVCDAQDWLNGTHVRLMFIGYFGALGIVWNEIETEADLKGLQEHPHCCGPFCFWLTVDAFATVPCAWMGNLRRFDGWATLSGANGSINPPFYPIFSIWGQICCIYNCEILVNMQPTADKLLCIIEDIRKLHRDIGGRTELRLDKYVVYFDMSFLSISSFTAYFKMLSENGVTQAAQHLGKFRMADMAPLEEVDVLAVHRSIHCWPVA